MFSTCLYLHLFHLAQAAQSPSLLSQMIGYPSVSWLNNIPLCVGTISESLHLDRNSPRAWNYMTSLIMALLLLTHTRYTKNEWGHTKSPPPMPSCLDFSVFLSFFKKIIYLFLLVGGELLYNIVVVSVDFSVFLIALYPCFTDSQSMWDA